jgi:hypothetical protein
VECQRRRRVCHQVEAEHVDQAAAGDGPPGAELVRERADEGRRRAEDQILQRQREGEDLAAPAEVEAHRRQEEAEALAHPEREEHDQRAAGDRQRCGARQSLAHGTPLSARIRPASAAGNLRRGDIQVKRLPGTALVRGLRSSAGPSSPEPRCCPGGGSSRCELRRPDHRQQSRLCRRRARHQQRGPHRHGRRAAAVRHRPLRQPAGAAARPRPARPRAQRRAAGHALAPALGPLPERRPVPAGRDSRQPARARLRPRPPCR